MKAWQLTRLGIDGLELTEVASRPLGPGEIRLRMRACSLNYRDLLMVRGQYDPRLKLPLIPLSDGVGEVVEVAPDVTRVAIGDRVAGCFAPRWIAGEPRRSWIRATRGGPLPGMLATEHICDAEGVVRVPAGLTDEQACTLPCAALTAWSALVTLGRIRAGDVVLVQGTGGVSLFALQFAVMHGARVIVTSSNDEKLARARKLGAEVTLNYVADPQWGKTAASHTEEGVDHIVEVGGAGTLEQSLRAVRPGGTIAMIGILSGAASTIPLTRILMSQVRVQGVLVGHREGFEQMNRAVEAQALQPVLDRVFPFEEAAAAFRHLESGAHFGKVVVRVSP